jgi:hypothetical protein
MDQVDVFLMQNWEHVQVKLDWFHDFSKPGNFVILPCFQKVG